MKIFFYIFFFILHLKTLSWCLLLYDFNNCFGSYNYTLHNKNGTLASPLLMFASRKNIEKHHILRWILFYQNEKNLYDVISIYICIDIAVVITFLHTRFQYDFNYFQSFFFKAMKKNNFRDEKEWNRIESFQQTTKISPHKIPQNSTVAAQEQCKLKWCQWPFL